MISIYTYGGQPAQRHLTVQCLLDNKAAGKRMTQVTAFNAEEARAAAEQHLVTQKPLAMLALSGSNLRLSGACHCSDIVPL